MEDNYVRKGKGGSDSNLFPGLDADTMSALIASEKNWNTDFKGNGLQKAAVVVDFTSKLPVFATYVATYVTNIVTSYLAQATVDMLSIDASQIISNAAAKLPNFIKDHGEIMGELLKDAEDITKELVKKGDTNFVNNLNNVIGEEVSKLTGDINVNLDGVKGVIEDIGKYTYMGPAWVKSKVDLESKKMIENCCKQIASVRDTVKTNAQKQIDSLAEGIAKKQAEQANAKVKDATKAQMDEVNKAKAQAMNKAKTAITNAKLKLMAMIGG